MANSSMSSKHCVLRSRNYKLRDINIPDQEPVIIGRGIQTKIRDHKCSKTQIQITADYQNRKATILQLGANPSEVDNKLLISQEKVEVSEGCSLNLIADDLKYTLEFPDTIPQPRSKHKHHKHSPEVHTSKKFKTAADEKQLPDFSEHVEPSAPPLEEIPNSEAVEKSFENDSMSTELESKDWNAESIQKAVMNDFNELTTEDRWDEYDHSKIFIFTPSGLRAQEKVAAFDMDNTIICTQSGKVFPTSTDDWRIMYAEIPGRIKKLHSEGFKIVLFTNQKGISRRKTSAPEFKKKVQRIVQKIGVPIQVFVSTGSGKYRKPNTGMWDYFLLRNNLGTVLNIGTCIYVGDAAGRPEGWAHKKKKDFSCADRLFALNIGIKFFTPEEFFLGHKPASFKMPTFDPRKLGSAPLAVKHLPTPMEELNSDTVVSSSSEVVVFVGYPASGKTHFAKSYLIPRGYSHINRDTLGSWQKCVSECSKALGSGLKVVIDNTNPDSESRIRYVEVAKKFGVSSRCFLFDCSLEQAKHNNMFRQLLQTDDKHVGVNDMVLNGYKSKFKEPTLKEGFCSIVKVNFVPKFQGKHEENLFRRFLIEK